MFTSNIDISIHFVGAFWVGMYFILPAILGMLSNTKSIVVAGFVTSLLGICIAFTGVISDGSAFTLYSDLKACGRLMSGNLTTYGNSAYYDGEISIKIPICAKQ